MEHRPDLSDAGSSDSPHLVKHAALNVGKKIESPNGAESRILIKNTWNTEILPELTPKDGDIVISKHRYSAFYQTDLDTILKTLGIKYVIVTGCATSVCVDSTVRDAMYRDYSCVLLKDCIGDPVWQPRTDEATLQVIERLFGWVSDSDEFMKALSKQ